MVPKLQNKFLATGWQTAKVPQDILVCSIYGTKRGDEFEAWSRPGSMSIEQEVCTFHVQPVSKHRKWFWEVVQVQNHTHPSHSLIFFSSLSWIPTEVKEFGQPSGTSNGRTKQLGLKTSWEGWGNTGPPPIPQIQETPKWRGVRRGVYSW